VFAVAVKRESAAVRTSSSFYSPLQLLHIIMVDLWPCCHQHEWSDIPHAILSC